MACASRKHGDDDEFPEVLALGLGPQSFKHVHVQGVAHTLPEKTQVAS